MAVIPQLNIADKAARKAAAAFRRSFGEIERGQVKGADVANDAGNARVEIAKILMKELEGPVPVISADMAYAELPTDAEAFWLVAPVSSWSNFSPGREPVGIALTYVEKAEPVMSCFFNPLNDVFYSASVGNGAQSSNLRLRVAGRKDLQDCLFTLFGRGKKTLCPAVAAACEAEENNRRVSNNDFYADVLDLAGGKIDILAAEGLSAGEMAFAKMFLREAGCYATDASGNALVLGSDTLIASNSKLHAHVVKGMKAHAA